MEARSRLRLVPTIPPPPPLSSSLKCGHCKLPVRLLPETSTQVMSLFWRLLSAGGIDPTRRLELKSSHLNFVNNPISEGIVPESMLSGNQITFMLSERRDSSGGIVPRSSSDGRFRTSMLMSSLSHWMGRSLHRKWSNHSHSSS